jgi:hypothetical protein
MVISGNAGSIHFRSQERSAVRDTSFPDEDFTSSADTLGESSGEVDIGLVGVTDFRHDKV